VLIPEIEREVNTGKTFADLRQIFQAVILATWYKENLKESLLGKVYVDQAKTGGIDSAGPADVQQIYDRYVAAFKRGVYDFIKEDYDPVTQGRIPRRYFSGGANLHTTVDQALITAVRDIPLPRDLIKITTDLKALRQPPGTDQAMISAPARTELDPAYNALPASGLQDALRDIRKIASDGSSALGRVFAELKGDAPQSFAPYKKFLARIGEETGMQGPVVYNPFGGMDALTGFLLPDYSGQKAPVTDVISFGLNKFGTPSRLKEYLAEFMTMAGEEEAAIREHPFLKYAGFDDYYQFYLPDKDKGLGLAALLRTMLFLEGTIEGLYYFDVDPETGELRFIDPESLPDWEDREDGPFVLIEFVDAKDNLRKRFWYAQTNVSMVDKAFDAFIGGFDVNGLILKATFEDNLSERSFFVYQKILAPAIRGNARVVADVMKNDRHAVIWKADQPPQEMRNDSDFMFGYTYPEHPIAFGAARDLYTWALDEQQQADLDKVREAKHMVIDRGKDS
ncbi:MAG: hypothetical protein K8I00_12805, partial [Candidatus Omnitrophica bacterium]|nr:hypothetical protein [Candidatus Omnitrophota bacterium]